MKTIARGSFTGTNAELRAEIEARVTAFKAALADHAKTVDQPAPREDDLVEELARSGEAFEIEPEIVPKKAREITPEQLAAQDLELKRLAALRALDDARLAAAAADPSAPQEVKDYAAMKTKAIARSI